MRGPCYDCVPVSIALALMLAASVGTAFAQDSNKLAATFNERFPVEETSTQPPLESPEVKKEHNVTTTRAAKVKRPRVVVVPRTLLPGDRKFFVKEAAYKINAYIGGCCASEDRRSYFQSAIHDHV
jgi:hypothetical protein